MAHVEKNKSRLLGRVRRIAGQVAALEKALEDGVDCGDLLVQIAAARGAMHGLMMEVLSGHLREHVAEAEDAASRAQEADAVIELLRTYVK
jgi:DNA-binding FrmR family transcriptional regulator